MSFEREAIFSFAADIPIIDESTGLRCDQTIVLTGPKSSQRYPIPLRRVSYYAEENDTRFVFLTNDFFLPPLTVAAIYRHR